MALATKPVYAAILNAILSLTTTLIDNLKLIAIFKS
jgi:hypothetical protein